MGEPWMPFQEMGPHLPRQVPNMVETDGIVIGSVTLQQAGGGHTDEIMLGVVIAGTPMNVIVKLSDEALGRLPKLVTDAVRSTKKHRRLREEGKHPFDQLARQANERESKKATCPGCGVRIFREVAARGGCFSCYPELPADQATPIGEDESS